MSNQTNMNDVEATSSLELALLITAWLREQLVTGAKPADLRAQFAHGTGIALRIMANSVAGGDAIPFLVLGTAHDITVTALDYDSGEGLQHKDLLQ